MSNRTLVKVSASKYCIGFKTISRQRKSGQVFLITRDRFARLDSEEMVIAQDIHSFAVLRRDVSAGTLTIEFAWLRGNCDDRLTGWQETVTIPYDDLAVFVQASSHDDGPEEWEVLSVQGTAPPKIEVIDTVTLHQCLENRLVRSKLSRALRDNFWDAERVILYHDFEAYSFMFQSFRRGRGPVTGGLILHRQDDMKKAYYSVHT